MPYKSRLQQRKFHAMANSGEMSKAEVHKWDEATKRVPGGFKGLPLSVRSLQHVASKGRR